MDDELCNQQSPMNLLTLRKIENNAMSTNSKEQQEPPRHLVIIDTPTQSNETNTNTSSVLSKKQEVKLDGMERILNTLKDKLAR